MFWLRLLRDTILVAVVIVALIAVRPTTPATPAAPEVTPTSSSTAASPALVALDTLAVSDTPVPGYYRDAFGPTWADVDANGCRTRDDILARDLTGTVIDADGCTVTSGTLTDPYTAAVIAFTRGQDTSADVQIDHVVALANVWASGGHALDESTRLALANDPLNLLAVDGPTNQAKSASDASEWLPPNEAYRCEYVARQVAVKVRYQLSVTSAERAAMIDVLTTCPDQPLP